MRTLWFPAATAALSLLTVSASPAFAGGEADPVRDDPPCAGNDSLKPKPKAAPATPAPAPQPAPVVEEVTPNEVVITIEEVVPPAPVPEPEPTPPVKETSSGAPIQLDIYGGASGGSWPVAPFVLDARRHNGVASGEMIAGVCIDFGVREQGNAIGGVCAGGGMGLIDSISGSGALEAGAMLSDRIGLQGVANASFRNLLWVDRTYAAQYYAVTAGPQLVVVIDHPTKNKTPFEALAVIGARAGAGGFTDVPGTFGTAVIDLTIRIGLDFSQKD